MSIIKLSITVADITAVMNIFDKIKIYRSTTTSTGVFTEITTPTTRPTLELTKVVYIYTDSVGRSDYWYRSSYYNTLSGLESSQSDPQVGESDPALAIISVEDLKNDYLYGVNLVRDDGTAFPDSVFEWHIKSAVERLEQKIDTPLRVTRYELEKHDFFREDYDKYLWFEVDHYPIINVELIQLVLPGNTIVQTFDPNWIHPMLESGQVQIVPGVGAAGTILLGASGAWIPFIYGTNRFIPDAFQITYTAGFMPGTIPYRIRDVIGKMAAIGPLNMAGEMILGAGVSSTSLDIDGLSQTMSSMAAPTGGAYSARVLQYQDEIKEEIEDLINYYKGLKLQVL